MRQIKALLILLGFLNPSRIRALMRDGATEDEMQEELTREEDISFIRTFFQIFMQPDSDLSSDVCPAHCPVPD
ncbi:MAG: hypothetical protein WC835_01145 [Candidatus Paceibacterota bacterium]